MSRERRRCPITGVYTIGLDICRARIIVDGEVFTLPTS